jgi:hypothetical protein
LQRLLCVRQWRKELKGSELVLSAAKEVLPGAPLKEDIALQRLLCVRQWRKELKGSELVLSAAKEVLPGAPSLIAD